MHEKYVLLEDFVVHSCLDIVRTSK